MGYIRNTPRVGLMLRTEAARWRALYWMRQRRKPSRRGLVNRYRLATYPRARKAGPRFPSIRPSRPDLPKFIF